MFSSIWSVRWRWSAGCDPPDRTDAEMIRGLELLGDPKADFIVKITRFYVDFHKKQEGIDGCVINDPLAVGYFINSDLCKGIDVYTTVETKGLSVGQTIVDEKGFWEKEGQQPCFVPGGLPALYAPIHVCLIWQQREAVLR